PPSKSTLFPYTTLFRSTDENRYAIGHLFVRRDLLVFAFRSCAICWAHAPRSCGKTGRGTSARATEECSRPGACDRAVAIDVGCRSEEHTSELQSRFDLV